MDKPFEERRTEFMAWLKTEYKAKMDELGCDMMSLPMYIPDGTGGFRTVINTEIVDLSISPVKSPFKME